MKKQKETRSKKIKNIDAGRIFVKVMAGFLAILMLFGVSASLIYALIG